MAVSETWHSTWRRMGRTILAGVFVAGLVLPVAVVRGDEFGRIVGPALFDIPGRSKGGGVGRLSVRAIEALPEVVRGERSALIVATTDQGNLAKLLVSQGLRRVASGGGEPKLVPVISLDRFETIDAGDRVARKAQGHGVLLFDGFEYDLDTGQVVPAGFGGDIGYSSGGPDGPALIAVGKNRLYAVDRPVEVPGSGPGRPSAGPAVLPSDFDGRYTLVSNGQMSGALELSVAGDGVVSGRFRSDRNGGMYPVSGKVAADLNRRITFEVQFPRSRQAFDGLLWTEDKNVFAGTVQILGHPYSFVAVREGTSLMPGPIDATDTPASPKAAVRVVTLMAPGDRYQVDGVARSADELATALAAGTGAPIEVLLRVPRSLPFERVRQAVQAIRGAGAGAVRLGEADPPE